MNIFVTNKCAVKSAEYLDDKRVIKMVLESAQLLSTAINEGGGKAPYKSTHINHPCSVWTRTSRDNYLWLLRHFVALCAEYEMRYNKQHKCCKFFKPFIFGMIYVPKGKQTEFVNVTTYKEDSNVFNAYKNYLNDKWINDVRKPTRYMEPINVTL